MVTEFKDFRLISDAERAGFLFPSDWEDWYKGGGREEFKRKLAEIEKAKRKKAITDEYDKDQAEIDKEVGNTVSKHKEAEALADISVTPDPLNKQKASVDELKAKQALIKEQEALLAAQGAANKIMRAFDVNRPELGGTLRGYLSEEQAVEIQKIYDEIASGKGQWWFGLEKARQFLKSAAEFAAMQYAETPPVPGLGVSPEEAAAGGELLLKGMDIAGAPVREFGAFSATGGVPRRETGAGKELDIMDEEARRGLAPRFGTPERKRWDEEYRQLTALAENQARAIYAEKPLWQQLLAEAPLSLISAAGAARAVGVPERIVSQIAHIEYVAGGGPVINAFMNRLAKKYPKLFIRGHKVTQAEMDAIEAEWNAHIAAHADDIPGLDDILGEGATARAAETVVPTPAPEPPVSNVITQRPTPNPNLLEDDIGWFVNVVDEAGNLRASYIKLKPRADTRPVARGREIATIPEQPAVPPETPAQPVSPLVEKPVIAETPVTAKPVAGSEVGAGLTQKEPWQMTKAEFIGLDNTLNGEPLRTRQYATSDLDNARTRWDTGFTERAIKSFDDELIATGKSSNYSLENEHYSYVKQALSEGKPIPPDVLKDYPELARLKPSAPKPATPVSKRVGGVVPPGYSVKAKDFVNADYLENIEDELWHVTTAKSKVLSEGLKARSETKTVGLGGGIDNQSPDLVSVTFDEAHASVIAERLRLATEAARKEIKPEQIIDIITAEVGLDDTPIEIAKALNAPKNTYEDWDVFIKWVNNKYSKSPYSLLQELDDALVGIYPGWEGFGLRIGLTGEESMLRKINPDEIGILKVAAKGKPVEHIADEAELRFKPEDLFVVSDEVPVSPKIEPVVPEAPRETIQSVGISKEVPTEVVPPKAEPTTSEIPFVSKREEGDVVKKIKDKGVKNGFDVEVHEGVTPDQQWASLTVGKGKDRDNLLEWFDTVSKRVTEEESNVLYKTVVQESTKKPFLPFKSIRDLDKFLDTGDVSLISTGVQAKGEPWSAKKLAETRARLAEQDTAREMRMVEPRTRLAAEEQKLKEKIGTLSDQIYDERFKIQRSKGGKDYNFSEITSPKIEKLQAELAPLKEKLDKLYSDFVGSIIVPEDAKMLGLTKGARPIKPKSVSEEVATAKLAEIDQVSKAAKLLKTESLEEVSKQFPEAIIKKAQKNPEYADISITRLAQLVGLPLSSIPGGLDQSLKSQEEEGEKVSPWLVLPAAVGAVLFAGPRGRSAIARGALRSLPDFVDFDTVVKTSFRPDNLRKLARAMDDKPVLKQLTEAVGGKSAIADENPVLQMIVGREVQRQATQTYSTAVMSRLNSQGKLAQVFGNTGADGKFATGNLKGVVPDDLWTYPDRYANRLTREQRRWIDTADEIERAKLDFLRRNGIEVNELSFEEGGRYAGRKVYGKVNPDGDMEIAYVGAGPSRMGAKTGFEKARVFENPAEALKAGYRYLPRDEALALNVQAAYNRVNDKQAAEWLLQKIPWRGTGVADEVVTLKRMAHTRLQKIEKLDKIVNLMRGGRLDAPYESTMRSMGEYFPQLDTLLRQTANSQGAQRVQLVRELKSRVKEIMATERHNFEEATRQFTNSREAAMKPGFNEAALYDIPAFSGKILTGDEAKKSAQLLRDAFDPKFNSALTALNKANAVGRFFALAGDASPLQIQLLFAPYNNPAGFVQAVKGFGKALVDGDFISGYFERNADVLAKHPGLKLTSGGRVEQTEALREGGLMRSKIMRPFKKVLEPFQRAYEAALDVYGVETAKQLQHLATDTARTADVDGFINKFRGVLDSRTFGVSPLQRQAEGASILATQYNRATIALLTDFFRGGLRGGLAREGLLKGIAGVTAGAVALSLARGESWEEIADHLNPMSNNFLTWRIAGQNIGPGGKVRSIIRLLGRWAEDPAKMPEATFDWLRGNFSPVLGTGLDVIQGENFMGEPTRPKSLQEAFASDKAADGWLALTKTVLGENLLPIWTQNLALGSGDPMARMLRGTAEFAGWRATEASPAQMRDDLRKEIAEQSNYPLWEAMPELERDKITDSNPELKKWTELARSKAEAMDTPEAKQRNAFYKRIEEAKTTYKNDVIKAAERGRRTGKWEDFKDAVKDAGKVLGKDYTRIYEAKENQPVLAQFEEWAKEGLQRLKEKGLDKPVQDTAYEEYQAKIIVAPDLETPDGFNFAEYERRIGEFKRKWGAEIWAYVQARKDYDKKDYPAEYFELQRAKEILKPYWALADATMSIVQRRYPNAKAVIEKYKERSQYMNEEEMEAVREKYPVIDEYNGLLKYTQQRYRLKNQSTIDAALVKYYGYKPIGLQGIE